MQTNFKIKMKKTTYIFLTALAITGLFSCKNTDNNLFTKRKYYHFKNGDTEVALNKPQTKQATSIVVAKTQKQIEGTPISNSEKQLLHKETSLIAASITTNKAKQVKVNRTLTNSVSIEKNEKTQEVKKSSQPIKQNTTKNSSSSEVNMVLLVILAILLPPLAVFFKEGSIGTNFWVDLLLCLLFWLPGVIFALLVILDVI
jgi:uncharacterized membrane protein YqaE (UPF0057 family)